MNVSRGWTYCRFELKIELELELKIELELVGWRSGSLCGGMSTSTKGEGKRGIFVKADCDIISGRTGILKARW